MIGYAQLRFDVTVHVTTRTESIWSGVMVADCYIAQILTMHLHIGTNAFLATGFDLVYQPVELTISI